jgi:hypothetical protein
MPILCAFSGDVQAYQAAVDAGAALPLPKVACPWCGALAWLFAGWVKRRVIEGSAHLQERQGVWWILVRLVRCRVCRRRTRLLPAFVVPYKQHCAERLGEALAAAHEDGASAYRQSLANGLVARATLAVWLTQWAAVAVGHVSESLQALGVSVRQGREAAAKAWLGFRDWGRGAGVPAAPGAVAEAVQVALVQLRPALGLFRLPLFAIRERRRRQEVWGVSRL